LDVCENRLWSGGERGKKKTKNQTTSVPEKREKRRRHPKENVSGQSLIMFAKKRQLRGKKEAEWEGGCLGAEKRETYIEGNKGGGESSRAGGPRDRRKKLFTVIKKWGRANLENAQNGSGEVPRKRTLRSGREGSKRPNQKARRGRPIDYPPWGWSRTGTKEKQPGEDCDARRRTG